MGSTEDAFAPPPENPAEPYLVLLQLAPVPSSGFPARGGLIMDRELSSGGGAL